MFCFIHFSLRSDGSEPETEIWEEDEENVLCDTEPPEKFDGSFYSIPVSSQILAMWILRFLMVMQAVFRITDTAIGHFLRFFVVFLRIIGRSCDVGRDIVECLPKTLYKARQVMGEVVFDRYVVCRKCFSIYTFEQCVEHGTMNRSKMCSFKRFPLHPHVGMRGECGTLLLKSVELASKKTYLYPFLTYCYLGVDVSLQSLFNRPAFYDQCEMWRLRSPKEGEMEDIYDGRMWKKFMVHESEPFLAEPGNLGLILNFDFFQPFEHLTYSLGVLYMSVLNLPRDIRHKQENTILVGLIPGPHEPKHDINTFLKPLVADLLKLWCGVEMRIASTNYTKKIRCALMCVSCDIPAGRKICGFLGHSARIGCSRCLKEFQGTIGSMDYSGFDRCNWKERTWQEHNAAAFSVQRLNTLTAIENVESRSGCRFSELLLLPYFDAPKMLVIDPMHNLFLGSAKYFLKNILIAMDYISKADLEKIQERVNAFIVPSGIGRIPMKIESGFSKFTADQWKNWSIYFSIITLRDMLPGDVLECWRHFVLACRVLCTRKISMVNAKLGDALLLQFCCRTEQLFGKETITPNMHLSCHLYECIVDYGPLHGFWCFAFERYNGILGAIPNNNRNIEPQLMQRFLRESHGLSFTFSEDDEISKELFPFLPKLTQTGSLADTVSSNTCNDQRWTIDSVDCVLPKFSSRCGLTATQMENAKELYSVLYSVPVDCIELPQTCYSYMSVVLNGKLFGTHKSRSASSSIVMATNLFPSSDFSSGLRAARIEKLYKHNIIVNSESKVHLLAYLSWFKPHPQSSMFGKPVSVWYHDLYDSYSFIPVHLLVSRSVSLIDNLNGESVLFIVPCVDF